MFQSTLFQRSSRVFIGLVFLAGLTNIGWTILSASWAQQLKLQGFVSLGILALSLLTVIWVWIAEQRLQNSVLAFIGVVGSTVAFCLAVVLAPVLFWMIASEYVLYTQFAYTVLLIIMFSHTPVLSLSGYRQLIQRFGLVLSIVLSGVMIGFLLHQFGRAYAEGVGVFVLGVFGVFGILDLIMFIWLPQMYERIAKSTANVKYTQQQAHRSSQTNSDLF
ncbi:MAG: hypothetical protein ABEI13_01950 [Candidatus Paceibacteria bacterium]